MDITSNPKLVRGARLRFDKVRESHVLMLPETAVMLSDTSAEILKLCDGQRSEDAIIRELETRYPGADLREDVLEFLTDARAQRWLA
jgi:pyrroloquinoline quinone biosynthesis protein D